MLDAELSVCTDCGTVHMEGGPGPSHVSECGACAGRLTEIEVEDLVGL